MSFADVSFPILYIIIGGLVAYIFALTQERKKEKRDFVTKYLISSYDEILDVSRASNVKKDFSTFERAIYRIQLFGDKNDIREVENFCEKINQGHDPNPMLIANQLRKHLRKELKLDTVDGNIKVSQTRWKKSKQYK